MAANMQPGTLRNNRLIRAKFIDFINDSLRFVLSATSGGQLHACPHLSLSACRGMGARKW